MKINSIDKMQPGEHANIGTIFATGDVKRRLLDIGLIENTAIECIGKSPCGDPMAYLVRGAVIAIRSEDGSKIMIKNCERSS